jgi:WD40 repeat protein
MVALWDVRTLGNSLQAKRTKSPEPLAYYNCGRSINSVYFSPSGKYAVSTTMANKLDIFEDLHLGVAVNRNDGSKKSSKNSSSNNTTIQPKNSVRHDNMTGRWLTTFQAVFHPQLDLFVVGSMRQPRCIELFDPAPTSTTEQHGRLIRTVQGNGITAVVSRLAFHPRMDQLIVCGGNSSGRVTIVRQ